jgi:hypothetical protein
MDLMESLALDISIEALAILRQNRPNDLMEKPSLLLDVTVEL